MYKREMIEQLRDGEVGGVNGIRVRSGRAADKITRGLNRGTYLPRSGVAI